MFFKDRDPATVIGTIAGVILIATLLVVGIVDLFTPSEPADWVDCAVDKETVQVHETVRMYMLNTQFLRDITIDREEPYKGYRLISVTEDQAGHFNAVFKSAKSDLTKELSLPPCDRSE